MRKEKSAAWEPALTQNRTAPADTVYINTIKMEKSAGVVNKINHNQPDRAALEPPVAELRLDH